MSGPEGRGDAEVLPWVLLGLVLGLGLVYGLAFAQPEAPNSQGLPHPTHALMLRGGSGQERHERILVLGWALGVLFIALFLALIVFGLLGSGKQARGVWWLVAVGLIHAGLFTLLVVLYHRSLDRPDAPLIGGLPAPTAVLLYALAPWPVLFLVYYLVMFDRCVLTPKDLERFRDLVATQRRRTPRTPEGA